MYVDTWQTTDVTKNKNKSHAPGQNSTEKNNKVGQ